MTRRIFRSTVFTATLSALLAAVLIVSALFAFYEDEMADELRAEANLISYALSREENEADYFRGFVSDNRVTLIASDGKVVYDSEAQASTLSSHADRPEVISALENGWGENERYSDTLAETTYYYAVRTEGGNVVRVASRRNSMLGVFLHALPILGAILAVVVLFSLVIARFSARSIVAPINALNLKEPLKSNIYDELAPLLTRMDRYMRARNEARLNLNSIVENMREGLILLDYQGKILAMNQSAAQVLHMDIQEHIGRDMLDVVYISNLGDVVYAALTGRSANMTIEQDEHHYQLLANPVMRGGSCEGVAIVILDVTEQYAAELSRREFTANVSHELKTPLTSISGYAEIIRDGVARSEDVVGFAGRIHTEASRLLSLINDIMALSRLDERRGIGEKEQVNLLAVANEAAAHLDKLAGDKKIALQVDGDDVQIMAYPVLLGEMLFNLVDNAVKYTLPGGSVHVHVQKRDGGAALSVQDTGIGIPREHQARIFERFYRVDKSHSRSSGGTGLGLPIVKHGADIHGAQIRLESGAGKGTLVELFFPDVL